MGFFGLIDDAPKKAPKADPLRGVSVSMLHKQECKACPLNRGTECKHPKMEPAGSKEALIYILGASPNAVADRKGTPWAGTNRAMIESLLPTSARKQLRWGNVIRTYPGPGEPIPGKDKEKTPVPTPRIPTHVEIECCRPSIIRDIEECEPVAIFGFGSVPLKWAANETHPYQWQGRRIPVKIGKHECWYYPFMALENVLADRRWSDHVPDSEETLGWHLRKAFNEVMDPEVEAPYIHTREYIFEGVEHVTGKNGWKDIKTIERHLEDCANGPLTGLDYETNKLRPYYDDAFILTAATSTKDHTLAFPFNHKEAGWDEDQLTHLEDAWREFLLHAPTRKIAHQLAFEMEWSAYFFGREVLRSGKWGDTISQAYVIDETQGLLALEALTMQYFGFNLKELSPEIDRKNMDKVPLLKMLPYNGLDAKYHRALWTPQKRELERLNMMEVYEHQVRRVPTLVLTQMQGIPINQKDVKNFRSKYDADVAEAEDELAKLKAVKDFRLKYAAEYRPTAAQDLAKMLKMLGHTLAKTEKGGDATDEKNLKKIDHPVIKWTIKHRKASKILSTYVDAVTAGAEDNKLFPDGLARPIISTYKVQTWRTSSEDFNIQNWPKRGPNVVIRKVVNKPGHKIVAFDYGSIQARCVAMESGDAKLIQSFIDGYDIHKDWVEHLAKLYPKWALKGLGSDPKVFKDARGGVKNQFVFPTFFGSQPTSIGRNLAGSGNCEVPKEAVAELQEHFFSEFPDIKKWHKKVAAFYKKNGYVTGLSQHRRHAPVSYNQLINAPIQADESLIVLSAMSALSEKDYKLYQPSMEIHDDLTFIWPEKEVEKRAQIVLSEMCKPRFDWIDPVPLMVEMSVGDNWCDLKEVGKYKNKGTKGDFVETHA